MEEFRLDTNIPRELFRWHRRHPSRFAGSKTVGGCLCSPPVLELAAAVSWEGPPEALAVFAAVRSYRHRAQSLLDGDDWLEAWAACAPDKRPSGVHVNESRFLRVIELSTRDPESYATWENLFDAFATGELVQRTYGKPGSLASLYAWLRLLAQDPLAFRREAAERFYAFQPVARRR